MSKVITGIDLTSKYHTELTHFTVDAKVNEVIEFLQFFTAATVKHKNMPILLKSQNESNQNRARKYPQNTYMKKNYQNRKQRYVMRLCGNFLEEPSVTYWITRAWMSS